MKDRLAVSPGRVLITPENGSPYYATMTRADNPTQEGTPLNKNSLLKDTTAALLGGGADMVPDEALVALKGIIDGLTAADVGASRVEVGSYTGAGKKSASTPNTLTFGFEPKLVVVSAKADQYLRRCVFVRGVTRTVSTIQNNSATYGSVSVTWNGNALSWYDYKEFSVYDQLDASGVTYCYVAIG